MGYEDQYDLCVWDNGPVGVKHPDIVCKGCQRRTIRGVRWKCTKCADVDLCSSCYAADRHVLSHSFYRIDTPASRCVKVPKRAESLRIDTRGLFQHAKAHAHPTPTPPAHHSFPQLPHSCLSTSRSATGPALLVQYLRQVLICSPFLT